MFNNYSYTNKNICINKINVNAVSGGIYKTYLESWFVRLDLDSPLMEELSIHEKIRYHAGYNEYTVCGEYREREIYQEAKPITVLQMVLCGNNGVIAEIMYTEDLKNYLIKTNDNNN